MYVYCENGQPVQWPVYPDHLRHRKPQTSFGDVIAPETMAENGYLPFVYTDRPGFDASLQTVSEATPVLVDGKYMQAWAVADIDPAIVAANEAAQQKALKDSRKQAILVDLAAIDTKSIRALREGNATRIAELETQAQALRTELASL